MACYSPLRREVVHHEPDATRTLETSALRPEEVGGEPVRVIATIRVLAASIDASNRELSEVLRRMDAEAATAARLRAEIDAESQADIVCERRLAALQRAKEAKREGTRPHPRDEAPSLLASMSLGDETRSLRQRLADIEIDGIAARLQRLENAKSRLRKATHGSVRMAGIAGPVPAGMAMLHSPEWHLGLTAQQCLAQGTRRLAPHILEDLSLAATTHLETVRDTLSALLGPPPSTTEGIHRAACLAAMLGPEHSLTRETFRSMSVADGITPKGLRRTFDRITSTAKVSFSRRWSRADDRKDAAIVSCDLTPLTCISTRHRLPPARHILTERATCSSPAEVVALYSRRVDRILNEVLSRPCFGGDGEFDPTRVMRTQRSSRFRAPIIREPPSPSV